MSVYKQLKTLQEELKKFKADADSKGALSFFYFVEFCGNVKVATDTLFAESLDPSADFIPSARNQKTVLAIRRVAQKSMTTQKMAARATEPPVSKIWTADGISENLDRIKKLEQKDDAKAENLNRLESIVTEHLTVSNYKTIRNLLVQGLKGKKETSVLSAESLIPMKYRVFIKKNDIQTMDTLLNFLSAEIGDEEIAEIEKMNYVEFKYILFMILMSLRLTYEIPPNYEFYRFCAMFPKNPNENSGLVQKLPDLVEFTHSKMSGLIKSARMYEKFEQYEFKVLEP